MRGFSPSLVHLGVDAQRVAALLHAQRQAASTWHLHERLDALGVLEYLGTPARGRVQLRLQASDVLGQLGAPSVAVPLGTPLSYSYGRDEDHGCCGLGPSLYKPSVDHPSIWRTSEK